MLFYSAKYQFNSKSKLINYDYETGLGFIDVITEEEKSREELIRVTDLEIKDNKFVVEDIELEFRKDPTFGDIELY